MAETEKAPQTYGIALDSLSAGVMTGVVKIYQETVGETGSANQYKDQLVFGVEKEIDDLKSRGFTERRLGSTLNSHSKLEIRRSRENPSAFYFTFNPNLDPRERNNTEIRQSADNMRANFSSKVSEHLQSLGIGVEL
jgi:hypothetical protein